MANFRLPSPTGSAHGSAWLPVGGGAELSAGMAPGPPASGHRSAGTGDSDAEARRQLVLDVTQMVLDVVGVIEPTPFADLTSAGISVARGRWLDAVLSGISVVPYVGDLAKLGKLPRYVRTLGLAVELAVRDARFAAQILPVMQRLKRALDLFPASSNASVNRLKQLVDRFLRERRVAHLPNLLPDISRRFRFRTWVGPNGNTYRSASGRLGIPGKVRDVRNRGAQRGISGGTGDDAGHLIGSRFGAPGGAENLTLQNRNVNRRSIQSVEHVGRGGSYLDLENRWAKKLKEGWGIEVEVTDVIRHGDASGRPIARTVKWKEISPGGERTEHTLDFLNPHSVSSRAAQNIPPTVSGPRSATVHNLDDFRRGKP